MAARVRRGRVQSGWADDGRAVVTVPTAAAESPGMDLGPVFMRPERIKMPAKQQDLRIDRADGNAYTLESFLDVYGEDEGRLRWATADIMNSVADELAVGELLLPSASERDCKSRESEHVGLMAEHTEQGKNGSAYNSRRSEQDGLIKEVEETEQAYSGGMGTLEDLNALSLGGRDASCIHDLENSAQNRLSFEAEASLQRLLHLTSKPLTKTQSRGSGSPVIMWFRQDLRLTDNPALIAAVNSGRPVLPVYLHVPSEEDTWPLGGAAKYWLHHSLLSMSDALETNLGSKLLIFSGDNSLELLLHLITESGAEALSFNRVYEPWKISRDALVAEVLTDNGMQVCSTKGIVLFEPLEVVPDRDERLQYGFGSVGFFLNACDGHEIQEPLGAPQAPLRVPARWPPCKRVADLNLDALPTRADGTLVDWAKGIREFWGFGEAAAAAALEEFVREGCFHFESRQRFRADRKYTAVISPYMRFGELSPRTVFAAVVRRHNNKAKTFLRRLAWRDLAYWMLWKLPCMPDHAIRPHYAYQWWDSNEGHLRKWQRGKTGYPLVDAAMRQLWATGWMPNYMRHVVAGFLIEYLNLHWMLGERWFHDTLVDADVAINAYMWQNGGHSGVDQWNFVMHPVFAAKSCDPEGHYVRKWCPELRKLPCEFIHCPWEAPMTMLAASGVALGRTYPQRCVKDLEAARSKSLAAVVAVRRRFPQHILQSGHEKLILPDGRAVCLITRVDYREMSSVPLTKQTPDEVRDVRRRPKRDPMSVALADVQGAYDRMGGRI